MSRPVICFDVDGCLIDELDRPRYEVINLLITLSSYADIIIWSGGGHDYATRWVERLGLWPYVKTTMAKDREFRPAFAVDDQPDADLGLWATLVV